jgi:hypothetical protein
MKNNEIIKTLTVLKPNPWQKNPVDARTAMLEMEQTCRHLSLGKRYKVDGPSYKREVKKVDRRYRGLIRKAKQAE